MKGLGLLAVWVLSVTTSGCDHELPASRDPGQASAPVRTAVVERQAVPVHEEVVGTVRPRYQASVAAELTGRIIRTLADPGARVEEGQLLAELDVRELRSSRDRAQANLDSAQSDWERYRQLEPGRVASKSEIDRAEAAYLAAKASLEEVERRLEDAEITAPFAGVVTRRFMDAGDLATAGVPVFQLEDPAHLRLEIDVAESVAGSIELEQELPVRIDGAKLSVEAPVVEIAPSADAGSRTFLVKLDLPADPNLRAGQFGRAALPRGEKESLVIPRAAVVARGQLEVVFVVEEGRAAMRIVRTGGSVGDGLEVLAGLEEGEVIVVEPPSDLRGGQILEFQN